MAKLDSSGRWLWTWTDQHTKEAEFLATFQADSKNDMLIAGRVKEIGDVGRLFIMKLNNLGSLQWRVSLHSHGMDQWMWYAPDWDQVPVQSDSLDNVSVAGSSSSRFMVVKFNSSGSWQWTAMHYHNESSYRVVRVRALQLGSNDDVVVAGAIKDDILQKMFVAKFTKDGELSWVTERGSGVWSSSDQPNDIVTHLQVDSNDDVLVAGFSEKESGSKKVFLMKISNSGNWQWTKTYGSTFYYRQYCCVQDLQLSSDDSDDVLLLWEANLARITSSEVSQTTEMKEWLRKDVTEYQIGGVLYSNPRFEDSQLDPSGDVYSAAYVGGGSVIMKHSNGTELWQGFRIRSSKLMFPLSSGVLIATWGNSVVKLSNDGALEWSSPADTSVHPPVEPQCASDFIGISCNVQVFQTQSFGGLCLLDMARESLCKGIVYASSREHWWRCRPSQSTDDKLPDCDSWFVAKASVQTIYEAELGDLAVDFMAAALGLMLIGRKKMRSRCVYLPLVMLVSFVVDIVLEIIVVQAAGRAGQVFEEYKGSFCFSQGDGYGTVVKLEDMLSTIQTLAFTNIGAAVFGGLCDLIQTFREAKGNPGGMALLLTTLAALIEVFVGGGSFFMNTMQFVDELEAIEKSALLIKGLDEGHLCYHLNEQLSATAVAVGMEWVQPLLIIVPSSVVLLCFCCACFCGTICSGHEDPPGAPSL